MADRLQHQHRHLCHQCLLFLQLQLSSQAWQSAQQQQVAASSRAMSLAVWRQSQQMSTAAAAARVRLCRSSLVTVTRLAAVTARAPVMQQQVPPQAGSTQIALMLLLGKGSSEEAGPGAARRGGAGPGRGRQLPHLGAASSNRLPVVITKAATMMLQGCIPWHELGERAGRKDSQPGILNGTEFDLAPVCVDQAHCMLQVYFLLLEATKPVSRAAGTTSS
jgi:hypothetical protein